MSVASVPVTDFEATTIVLLGSFNPRIFQPAWFVSQALLPPHNGTEPDVRLINNDYCGFQTDWFTLQVFSERLELSTLATPAPEQLRDLLLGAFAVLPHTPVTRVTLASSKHFAMRNERSWHDFGHKLAPKQELWNPILTNAGTQNLTIQSERTDGRKGSVSVVVEPSNRVKNGLYIQVTDDFVEPLATSTDLVIEVLQSQWDNSRRQASTVFTHLTRLAGESVET